MASDCQMCGMVEGFTNDMPAEFNVAPNLPSQELVGFAPPPAGYQQYLKSESPYGAQQCIYTAQGEIVCPKGGLGATAGAQ